MSKRNVLACADCGSRNYKANISKDKKDIRLELKKYCSHCRTHTIHRFE